MKKKIYLRRKFFLRRKKTYFEINKNFFTPLVKMIQKKNSSKLVNLSIYYPSYFEVNVLKLFEIKYFDKFCIQLPIIKYDNTIEFYNWKRGDILQVNKFGMLEPLRNNRKMVPDIILVPLLAYDNKKNRLGYGKGFYDRYLKKYSKQKNFFLTIGVAFSSQKHHNLPITANDVKLDYILTEKGIF